MELTAVIEGLSRLKEPCEVTLCSDSKYVIDSLEKGWVYGWKAKNWMRKSEPVPNADLWQKLLPLVSVHRLTYIWVKGHNGHPYNERCDKLATEQAALFA